MTTPGTNAGPPAKTAGITETLSGSELFLYDAQGAELRVLNTSAMMIWSLCDGQHDPGRMVRVLARLYPDVDRDRLAADIARTIEVLRADGLLAAPPERND